MNTKKEREGVIGCKIVCLRVRVAEQVSALMKEC